MLAGATDPGANITAIVGRVRFIADPVVALGIDAPARITNTAGKR
jgi:hypothetical protein